MHNHFRETGHFRVEDIIRVLGDPAARVEIKSSNDASGNGVLHIVK